MRHGEVWVYEHPERKPRPSLILMREEAIASLFDVIAVPATTTIRGIDTEVPLDKSDGMPVECALSLDNTFLAEKSYFTRRIATLGPERMTEVCRALSLATGC